ncbi:MAG: DNA mismatch repair protein MutS, partial [Candidatus Puniceispirillaceae bacterium]
MITHPSTTNPPKVKAPTPMMAQYLQVKENQPDALLFYRMGDFYEMFFEDAEIAAAALGIALTRRGKNDGQDIPMCGVPVHALDGYLARLIKIGHRVAICEQTEDPATQKQRGGKGPLKREVVRVVTPGTLTEDELLPPRAHNYLAAIGQAEGQTALAWADMSTGDFAVQLCPEDGVDTMLARLDPAELIFPQDRDLPLDQTGGNICLTPQAPSLFDSGRARQALEKFYSVASLDGLGDFNRAMLSAAGALLAYIETTQIGNMPRLRMLRQITDSGLLEIDAATRRSLELTRTLTGERRGSLLHAVDRTLTAAGGRLLGERLAAPLADVAAIDARLDLVDWFRTQRQCCDDVRAQLRVQPDMQRALSRLSMGHGGPRDLAALATGLEGASTIVGMVRTVLASGFATVGQPDDLPVFLDQMHKPTPLVHSLTPALGDDLPLLARDGGFVRQGYDLALDELRGLRDESRRLIAALQTRYSDETGIASLKIKHNNVLGYHIEVRAGHAEKLMADERFIHRQTTAQAVRFTTTELAEMEQSLSSAADKALALELQLFDQLVQEVLAAIDAILASAEAVAALDVACSTAKLAEMHDYCCPKLCEDTSFTIEAGRHPVVEQAIGQDTQFIANDCQLSQEANLWLLTGPNMAGKSTYLRQNAHMAILAQAGFYVPARQAEIGIVDKIFSRVGASDDLARGQSTFMVEMVET